MKTQSVKALAKNLAKRVGSNKVAALYYHEIETNATIANQSYHICNQIDQNFTTNNEKCEQNNGS